MDKTVELMTPRGAALLALRDEAKELVSAIDIIEDWGWVAGRDDSERLDESITGTESAMHKYLETRPSDADGAKGPTESGRQES